MNIALSTALSGMTAATRRLDASATTVARAGTADAAGKVPDVDVAAEAVQQITSGITYKANAKVAGAADEMLKSVLDMKV